MDSPKTGTMSRYALTERFSTALVIEIKAFYGPYYNHFWGVQVAEVLLTFEAEFIHDYWCISSRFLMGLWHLSVGTNFAFFRLIANGTRTMVRLLNKIYDLPSKLSEEKSLERILNSFQHFFGSLSTRWAFCTY